MKYKLADLIIEFNPKSQILKERSEKYRINDDLKPDFALDVSYSELEKLKEMQPELDDELAEYMAVGSLFYKKLLDYNACVLHSSAVVVDNEAYLFSAPCGTGKSTHVSLWLKYLADKKPYILNDDNPAIRIFDDNIYAYGTPFSGKNDLNENSKAVLKGICFIEQSKENFIEKMEAKEAIKRFLDQTVRELDSANMLKLLDILDVILKKVPIYRFGCNISEEAVKLSYSTMKGKN